jgi:hypothetical protein
MHPLVCYAASCSLYAWVLYIHHRRSLTMSTFISSPDDDDDDIMITLLLLAMCYPPVNRTPSFRESLTVDEVRRRSGKIRHHALQHPLSSPFWTLFNSMMMLWLPCVGLTMLLSSSYTSCSNLVFIPLLPVGKIRISLLEIQQPRKVGKDTSVPSVV